MSMAKDKTIHGYQLEIKRRIKQRNGEYDEWLNPQLRAAAMNCVMLDKIQHELENATSLWIQETGVSNQVKNVAHPLLVQYDKLQRTLIQQFEALGLNYRTTPSKVTEQTKKGVDESDPMAQFYKAATK